MHSAEDQKLWLENFQEKVNEVTESENLVFTMEIWKPGEESRELPGGKVKVIGDPTFPYLDMSMFYDENENLAFKVFLKPGAKFKYLNVSSCHTLQCKDAIPRGVCIRHAELTTRTEANENLSLSEIYPDLHQELTIAGHLSGDQKLPTLGNVLDKREQERQATFLKREK